MDFLDSLSDADEQIPEMNGAELRIELVVNDDCVIPTLTKIEGLIRVTIGLNHDFDDVLDVAGGDLGNEELAHLHKLWSDDNFPRTFQREGANLIITARDDQ